MASITLRSTSTTATTILLLAAVTLLGPVAANQDHDALTALKNGLQDPTGELNNWNPYSTDPCTWTHVECDNITKRVIRLDLGFRKLSGHLAPELGNLDQLEYMEIHQNNIQGTIPAELGNLKNLISLTLYNNNLSGHIPPSLGEMQALKYLRLEHNNLSGPIPRELVGLSNLMILDLSNNDLCGTIPRSGAFQNIPLTSFANNPRLKDPELPGAGNNDNNC
ncbi:leucine-rich repeat protein 1-like [Lolium perenne]|uniref:leucine-rich repeat protein 1-like n=1 Tax=Lolium perenne TaxID=4522 RepID=UPI003A9940A2